MNTIANVKQIPSNSVLVRMAQKYGIDNDKMLVTLKATAFKGDVSNEQMMALCVVAEQYGLNPWTKEIYAFPSQGGIIPVVGVDGWSRIINSNPQFDGMDFDQGPVDPAGIPEWIECIIHRKDRGHPIKVKEYFSEVNRPKQGPWQSHPRRMLRHKAMIQCARLAFGFGGIYEPDEADRIIEAEATTGNARFGMDEADVVEVQKHVSAIVDILNADKDEFDIADMLRDYESTYLNGFPEVALAVSDKLKRDGIITKGKYREYLGKRRPNEERVHG